MMDDIMSEDVERIKEHSQRRPFHRKESLVTGGAGFIGSWLCDVLIGFGAEVTVIDDLSTGRIKNIEHLDKNAKKSNLCSQMFAL